MWVGPCFGGRADNVVPINGSTAWGRLTGCAYFNLRIKRTGNTKKAQSPFSSGLPSRMTCIGKGLKLYDPRRDSTVPGGSGPMRYDDQTTWRFVTDDGVTIGENLALQQVTRIAGWRINGKLSVGQGLARKRVNLESIITAANLCDELVAKSTGGTEPRYHGAGVASEGDDPKTIHDMLSTACCGRWRDSGGKLSLVIMHNDLAAAATDEGLNDDDVLSGFTWNPDPALEATPNIVRGKYTDPSSNSLYQMIPYPEKKITSPDGIDRVLSLDIAACESPTRASRIARQAFERKQYGRTFSAVFDIRAWKYGIGDIVPFTYAPLSFNRRLFRVKEQDIVSLETQDEGCAMVLEEESADIYAGDDDDALPLVAAAVIKYDSANNPLILGIGEAGESALWSKVDDDNGKKPEDNATVGSPPGTPVGNKEAQEVVNDLDLNGLSLGKEILRGEALKLYMEALTRLNGVPFGTVIVEGQEQFSNEKESVAQTFSLIGAKNGDGDAFVLNLDSVRVTPTLSMGQHLDSVNVRLGGVEASSTLLLDAVVTPEGGSSKAILSVTVNNRVSGFRNTNDGTTSEFAIVADCFMIVDPDDEAGNPFIPFQVVNGIVKMHTVEVDTLKVNTAVVPAVASASAPVAGAGVSSFVSVLTLPVTLKEDGIIQVIGAANQGFASVPLDWRFKLSIDGTVVWEPNGTYPGDSLPILGSKKCAKGARVVELEWAAASGVTLKERFLSVSGLNNTDTE
jgi:hypothetical protein